MNIPNELRAELSSSICRSAKDCIINFLEKKEDEELSALYGSRLGLHEKWIELEPGETLLDSFNKRMLGES